MGFADELNARVREVQRELELALPERVGALSLDDLDELGRQAHKLRGGLVGQPAFSERAAQLEMAAKEGRYEDARVALQALKLEAARIAQDPSGERMGLAAIAKAPERRVLVADDDPDIRRMTVMILQRAGGYSVDAMPSGEGVVERVLEGAYDLVIVDAMMPGMTGMDICHALRGLVPVVILSAAAPAELGIEFSCGWWRKPIGAAELLDSVRQLLGDA